ncbi:hydroxyacid dehydrogenase (plasmid) [Halorarum halophilum]|uniref:Hydroxyacid dehydrogenase n=1 Tax=Halorarum halophilum TaxID=2743090 RepID=A0A7D5KAL5_9EURY|nr:hydroxyacid dehydrogenase [Halobaculum halophilum]QLG29939.1 hydroxyacid dehydrogenase [Halobaculum halophilum]
MDILVTLPDRQRGTQTFFSDELAGRLEGLGTVEWNNSESNLTPDELIDHLEGVDVCMTGWGSPCIDREILQSVEDCQLELVTHIGGSVAAVVTDYAYDTDVAVCSANDVMAKFVGEYLIAGALTALRSFPSFHADMMAGKWDRDNERVDTLFDKTVGFVGLGTIGKNFLDHLQSFDVNVIIYDPYIAEEDLAEWEAAELAGLEDVLTRSDLVSIHVSKTEETVHLMDEQRLGLLPDGCLLINAARGAIVDTEALLDELRTGRISAVLDVYEHKKLEPDSELREIDNVVLTPHMAGSAIRHPLTAAMINEVERFARDDPLQHRIPYEQFELMTRPWIHADKV